VNFLLFWQILITLDAWHLFIPVLPCVSLTIFGSKPTLLKGFKKFGRPSLGIHLTERKVLNGSCKNT
jgi:hypothetical protein